MAQRIQQTAFELQEALTVAGVRTGAARDRGLEDADIALAKLRSYLRFSIDLGLLSMGQLRARQPLTDEIGRLIGGWRSKEREQRPAP